MSNLLALYSTVGNGLAAFQNALSVVQNNVDNSSTPGFATQTPDLEAQPFAIASGLGGGVSMAGLQNSRDVYAEESVQLQSEALGYYSAVAQSTSGIQSLFETSGSSGISAALDQLFQSFSAWSVTPSDATARQNVLSSASAVAAAINSTATSLAQTSQQMDGQIGSVVDQINQIATQIQQYNVQKLQQAGSAPDPGGDAQLYSALQNLAQLTDFSAVTQSNGTVTVMLSGGAPLVDGSDQYDLSLSTSVDNDPPAANPQSPPTAHILDAQGNDVTSQITSGELGGLLQTSNGLLGSILGNAQQQGSLNQFAQGLADTVNQILESGTVSSDPGAAQGAALFTYSTTDATDVAASLALNPQITSDDLAPVDASGNSNGNANALAALANATDTVGGMGLTQFFAQMAATAGQQNATATENQQTQQQIVAQAESLRDQVSGVSLDEQAVNVLQYQRAYQAMAQVLTVLDNLSQTIISLVQPAT